MRPELHDSDISRHVERRAAGEWRPERVLPAVRRAMDGPRTDRVATSRWAALAALVGLLGVLVLLAVALPRLDLAPAAPSPTPAGGIVVLSTEEFAARLAAGELDDLTAPLLVEGRIEADDRPSIECSRPSEPCPMGVLAGVDERVQVHALGVATVDPDDASVYLYSEEPWPHWRMPEPPIEGILVLAIDRLGSVNFLGKVTPAGADLVPWPPAAVADLDAASVAVDAAVIVEGWLTQVPGLISCRPPDPGTVLDGLPDKWCGNPAWIGPRPLPVDPAGVVIPDDFISVQHGAYFQFAENPAADADGLLEPRQGTYAIARRLYGGGCPENQPPCWDWQIVARLSSSPSEPTVTPAPTATQAPETPPAEAPPASLTCAQITRLPMRTEPPDDQQQHARVVDHTHLVERCITWLTLPDDSEPIALQQEVGASVVVVVAIDQVCDSMATLEFRGTREDGFHISVEYTERSRCRDWSGAQAVMLSFSEPIDVADIEATVSASDGPTSSEPPFRVECVEIFAPPASSDRDLGISITDHSGVVSACQPFGAEVGDLDRDVEVLASPLGTDRAFEIRWTVPEICDYMPAELEVWRTETGLLVHIDRKSVADQPQACRPAFGLQGVLLNLREPIMASSVETVLTTDGAAMSVVDMPAAGMSWSLSLVPDKTEYAVGEPIDIEAVLAYDGEMRTRTLVGSGSGLVIFSVGQLNGDLSMGGLMTADCQQYEITSGEPLTLPYAKGVAFSEGDPNADFYMDWVEDPVFTLPAGSWRIWAGAEFALGECGGRMVRLEASTVITVR
jgi:hypothetical protein